MAYAVLNKSGCDVHKGNVQIRLDLYLDELDPRYGDRYLYLVDVTSAEYLAGYSGEVDKVGNPIDQAEYDLWRESLPRIWENTPFHSHFIYLDANLTIEDIKAEMEFHLPNFYDAFQNRRDEVNGGMRHGWATEKRVKPTDYSKTDTSAGYDTRVAECQAVIDALTVFSFKPATKEGQEFPATAIDAGESAIDRGNFWSSGYTVLAIGNPANDTGILDTFEVWAETTMDGTNKVGTFYGSGTDNQSRDYATIGTVVAGAKRTFTGLSIDVSTNDKATLYYSAGKLEIDTSGYGGVYWLSGDQFGVGEVTFNFAGAYGASVYATGATELIKIAAETMGLSVGAIRRLRAIRMASGEKGYP